MTTYLWGLDTASNDGRRLIVPTPELGFLMHDDDSGRCQMFQVGVPELPIILWAAEKFGDKTKTFIDCGAHMGAYSILLANHFNSVVAFEAQKRTFFQLCGNIFINEIDNIQPYHEALTDPPGANQNMTLYVVSEDGGGSTLVMPQKDQRVLREEKVKTTTLDNHRLKDIGLIKMDIEGNELKALQGAALTLKKNDYPPIIFEANTDSWYASKKKELFNYLTSLNYNIAEIRPFNNMFLAIKS